MKRGNLMKKISNEIQILAETLTLPKVVIEQMIVQAKNILDEVFEQYSHEPVSYTHLTLPTICSV